MSWIIFSLVGPFFWALSNIFDKYALEKLTRGIADFIFFGTIGNALCFVLLCSVFGFPPLPIPFILLAMLGGLLLNYSYIFYAKALETGEVSRVVPLFQSIPIFVLILGTLFFGESIGGSQLAGFVVILLGGLVLTTKMETLRHFRADRNFWLMLTSSLLIALSFLASDTVLEHTDFWTLVTYDFLGFTLAGASLLLYRPWRKEIVASVRVASPRKYGLFLLNDVLDLTGHVFYKLALVAAPSAALVSVLHGIMPFYVLILTIGLTIFLPSIIKEEVGWKIVLQKVLGATLIFGGLVLVNV